VRVSGKSQKNGEFKIIAFKIRKCLPELTPPCFFYKYPINSKDKEELMDEKKPLPKKLATKGVCPTIMTA
jgi:hypothetical protein